MKAYYVTTTYNQELIYIILWTLAIILTFMKYTARMGYLPWEGYYYNSERRKHLAYIQYIIYVCFRNILLLYTESDKFGNNCSNYLVINRKKVLDGCTQLPSAVVHNIYFIFIY